MDVAISVSAIAEYDYTAKEPDELDLVKGAIIHNIKQIPGGWWEGTLQSNGKTGMFPDNFVRVVDSTTDENGVQLRDKITTKNRRCKVIYSYTQVNDDELSLAVGDVIDFLGEVEEGWWRGRLKTKVGVFPSNFVISIEPSPIMASKRPPSSTVLNSTITNSHFKQQTTANAVSSSVMPTVAAAAAATSSALSVKKTNRLSFHSSKEDLLSSNTTSTTTTTKATAITKVDEVAPTLPPKPQREFCRVEFPYAPQNDDELELKVGDVITIISMELPDKGWWKGELRGKVGVFPDNFVKLLAPPDVLPLHDTQQSQKTAKNSNANSITTNSAAVAAAATAAHNNSTNNTTSKAFVKKSGSSSSTQSSNRKDSFGSRDSLNDILSETGLPTGNVAAQRKSLENKNLDLSNTTDINTRFALKKQQLSSASTSTASMTTSTATATTTTTTTTMMSSTNSNSAPYTELRKSLENMDEKLKTTPPPVLTKKPTIPTKKSTGVTSVAGNILSGLKQKVKNVENKLTTTVSHDYADGIGSSKMSPSGLPDSAPSGNVVMRRAATIAVEDSDFDRVERGSILSDMRQGRVKAPKRRPPSAAINVIGESNNNNSVYLNGSNGSISNADLLNSSDDNKLQSSDDNSAGDEQLAKPKPREWEKIKAPWMEELKASQVKKKTSPSVEPRNLPAGTASVSERTSKFLADDIKITSTRSTSNSSETSLHSSTTTATKVQSSTISSSILQQSMNVESSNSNQQQQQQIKKEVNVNSITDAMSKSMSNKTTNELSTLITADDARTRPNSLALRNRSISPSISSGRPGPKSTVSSASSTNEVVASNNITNATLTAAAPATAAVRSTHLNNHNDYASSSTSSTTTTATTATIYENNIPAVAVSSNTTEGLRVIELEKRVEKLEVVVNTQQRTIDDLVRLLREETDRVKLLRGELDKYAQCVTQV